MSEPDYDRVGEARSTEGAYGPYSVLGVAVGLAVMAVTTVVPNLPAVLGWALFLGPPLIGLVLAAGGQGRVRQLGIGLAASATALATAIVFSVVLALPFT